MINFSNNGVLTAKRLWAIKSSEGYRIAEELYINDYLNDVGGNSYNPLGITEKLKAFFNRNNNQYVSKEKATSILEKFENQHPRKESDISITDIEKSRQHLRKGCFFA